MCLRVSYKKNMKKKKKILLPQSHWRKELDPDLYPLLRDKDPRIRNRTKMSQIPNIDSDMGGSPNKHSSVTCNAELFFCCLSDLDLLIRGMNQVPDPSLFS